MAIHLAAWAALRISQLCCPRGLLCLVRILAPRLHPPPRLLQPSRESLQRSTSRGPASVLGSGSRWAGSRRTTWPQLWTTSALQVRDRRLVVCGIGDSLSCSVRDRSLAQLHSRLAHPTSFRSRLYMRAGTVSTIALWGRSMGAATALLHTHRDPSVSDMNQTCKS